MKSGLFQRSLAEFIGTFALVFAGTGAIIVNDVSGGAITHVGIALTFGLVVMVMVYAVGPVSGAHLNPAVSVGFWLSGRFSARDVTVYTATQTLAAFVASLLHQQLFPTHLTLGATLPAGAASQAFAIEVVLTFFLMFVILNVTTYAKDQGGMAGAAIGATVGLDALFGGPVSGASMNPARSLAPAVVSGHLQAVWVYLAAPLVGSAIAVIGFKAVVRSAESPDS